MLSLAALRSRALVLFLTVTVAVMGVPLQQTPAAAGSADIVLSQIYGGGGNSGATLRNDFIELFNRGLATVDVSTWSVQYAAAAGTTWQKTNLSGSIAPGGYYLVQESAGTGGTTSLPAPDASGSINMSATAGKVALVRNQTTVTSGTSCPTGATIADFVGFGSTANCFEDGGPTPAPSNTTAVIRGTGGCTDADSNATDFAAGAPTPRNSATAAAPCGGVAISVAIVGSGSVTSAPGGISCPGGCSFTYTTGTSVTLSAAPGAGSEFSGWTGACSGSGGCTLTSSSAVTAVFGPAALTPIHEIQGAAHRSPLVDQLVKTSGVVTAKRPGGYYVQDPLPDADDATSEGIFIFGDGAALSVGDAIEVIGKVSEFSFGPTQLSTTEIQQSLVRKTGTGTIAPTVIGTGGRIPPTTIIENDASGSENTTNASFDPAQDGMDFYESLEGMLVQVNDAVAVSRTEPRFGELWVLGDHGANASALTPRGGIVVTDPDGDPSHADFNPERIMVDDEVFKTGTDPSCAPLASGSDTPCVNVGATFTGPLVGVMDYDFSTYRIQLVAKPTVASDPLARESTVPQGPNELAIATFNVQNLAPSDPNSKYGRLAGIIVNNLQAPDIVALEEIQDNSGATDNGVVAADVTLNKLISFISAIPGAPSYQFRSIDPVNDQDGGAPGGNIRVGYIFRTDRGLAFVDRPGATSTTANAVVGTGTATHLAYSPGRIDPNEPNGAWTSSRKPLAAEWTYNGHRLFTIADHFNSKLGDESLYGVDQPPLRASEVQRHKQAAIVNDFVKQLETADPSADVVVLGDLNDFQFSDTVTLLAGGELHTLIDTLPANERYTYVFEGNSQAIDHTLLSNHAFASLPWHYDVVHLNSEFADNASDHEPQVTRLALPADSSAPIVTPPADTFAEATSPSGAPARYGPCTATDDFTAPADLVFDYSVANDQTFPLGVTRIECGATDAAGNRGSATFGVHIVDTTKPAITSVPPSQTLEATSPAGAVATYADCTASDAAGAVTVVTPGSGSTFPLGATTVTCTATDASGNSSSASFTITVADTTKPEITLSPAQQTLEATSPAGAIATYTCTGSDIAGPVTITGLAASGGLFPLGRTVVTCTATDQSNNSSSASGSITVVDTTKPALTVSPDVSVEATSSAGAAATFSCSATDVVTPQPEITYSAASGSTFPLGTTPVTCTATDAAGNSADATFGVHVLDTTKPAIAGTATPAPNAAGWNSSPVTVQFTCSDLFLVSCTGDTILGADGAGQSVTGTATDSSHNVRSSTVGGINIDRTAPDVRYTGNAGTYTVDQTVSITCAAGDALSGIATNSCASIGGPAYAFLGTNSYHATATDAAGNSTTASVTFTVGVTHDSLCTLAKQLVTNPAVAASLCQKLKNAQDAELRGDARAADSILAAFGLQVDAQSGKAIPSAAAELLKRLAGAL